MRDSERLKIAIRHLDAINQAWMGEPMDEVRENIGNAVFWLERQPEADCFVGERVEQSSKK